MPTRDQSDQHSSLTRRSALQKGTKIAGVSALAGVSIPYVHAAPSEGAVRLSLIGCGGRGTGAVANAVAAGK